MAGEAGAAPAGVVEQVKKAPALFVDVLKKYWFIAPIAILAFMLIGMAAKPWFTKQVTSSGSATPGDKLGQTLRDWLRIGVVVLPIGILLSASAAFAGVGHEHIQCCAEQAPTWFGHAWQYIAGLLASGGIAFGISHLSAPDVLDGRNENNGRSIAYTPVTSGNELSMFMRTQNKNRSSSGAPLIACDTTIALDTTIEQASTGTNPIVSQDLARLLEYVEISSPFHGVILDKKTGTGPMLDLVINFIGQGFARSGDAATVTLTVPASSVTDTAVTKYFHFPWAQRYLDDPSKTSPWLGLLHNAEFKCKVASSTALAAVSTNSVAKNASKLRLGTSYAISPYWRQSYLPYWRLDTPASGSDGLVFKNFGGTGPSCTKAEDILHTVGQLSNLKGLPGNLTFDTVTNIVAPTFGIDDVSNIDMLVNARLQAQFFGRIGNYDYSTGGNHVAGTVNNGMALDKLLFLLLRQPSLDLDPNILPRLKADSQLDLREVFSSDRTGADAFIVGSLRELSTAKLAEASTMSGGLMPANLAQARHFRLGK